MHHIVPLSLGGGNDFENVAYVEQGLERDIHAFIDRQGKPEIGERKIMIIPKRNDKIWFNNQRDLEKCST